MSRSIKKNPVVGHTCAESEKQDKRFANRRFRKRARDAIAAGKEPPASIREVSEVWTFAKDGKHRLDAERFPQVRRK